MTTSKGLDAIAGERNSQLSGRYTPEHDAKYTGNQLVYAAEAHIYAATGDQDLGEDAWPWDKSLFHLNTPVSSLAKAGALIAAEIDRRFAAGECKETDFGHPFPEPPIHMATVDNRNMGLCGTPIDKTQRATLLGVRVSCTKCKELL